jgi:hypothetical protein
MIKPFLCFASGTILGVGHVQSADFEIDHLDDVLGATVRGRVVEVMCSNPPSGYIACRSRHLQTAVDVVLVQSTVPFPDEVCSPIVPGASASKSLLIATMCSHHDHLCWECRPSLWRLQFPRKAPQLRCGFTRQTALDLLRRSREQLGDCMEIGAATHLPSA